MMPTKQPITSSARQIRGLLIFIAVLLVTLICIGIKLLIPANKQTLTSNDTQFIELNAEPLHSDNSSTENNYQTTNTDYNLSSTTSRSSKHNNGVVNLNNLKAFDPNTVAPNTLLDFGLSEKLVQTLSNYRNKGGKFYKKEDLMKIYGMKPQLYAQLAPFINIKSTNNNHYQPSNNAPLAVISNEKVTRGKTYSSIKKVELNQATYEQLIELKGIGETFANRIIKHRNILGGFYDVQQLKEVYGIKDSLYNELANFIEVNPHHISKLNINQINDKELYKHPYFRDINKPLILYRDSIGGFKNMEDIKKCPLLNEEKFRKIVAYINL